MPDVRIVHDGARNTSVQIVGRAPLGWSTIIDLDKLQPRPKEVRLDAVYYAISDKTEVQLAWACDEEGREPFLPLGGRGKIDFGEVTGVHNTAEGRNGHIDLAAFGEGIFTIILDLSKHQGA